jgi:hypothetical protein
MILKLLSLSAIVCVASWGIPPAETAQEDSSRWGRDGHKILCEIAYREVNARTRSVIDGILASDDDYDSFPESCLWADVIRRQEEYSKFPTAHYMNIPRGANYVSADEQCASTYCVVEAVDDMESILEGRLYNEREKLEALKFLSHFVGDLHQPLHAGYEDDRGGNSMEVTAWGEKSNLHSVWDYVLIEHTGRSWSDLAEQLWQDITPIDRQLWARGSVTDWVAESYRIVEDSVYDIGDDGVIGDEYYQRNLLTIETQLKKAGIRLATVLDRALGS